MDDKEKLQTIAQHYGWDMQSVVCMEECAELIQAISKYRRAAWIASSGAILSERRHVISEMSDVEIMLLQLSYLLGADVEVALKMQEKIDRQIHRIKEREE